MRYHQISGLLMLVMATLIALPSWAKPEAEVLHWCTAEGESNCLQGLKDEFNLQGGKWIDSTIATGRAGFSVQALKARVLAGDPPTAVQLRGPFIQKWHRDGALNFIDTVALNQKWNKLLSPWVRNHMLCDGRYCAAPINVHRIDWIWGSKAVLTAAEVHRMPRSWQEFNTTARKVQAIGKIALAHGDQAWQNATIFETVVLGIGGNKFYQQAMVDLDLAALNSDTMVRVFDQMRIMQGFVDEDFKDRSWQQATAMVINDKAAFQIMGDWVKGEFSAANKKLGKDFYCSPAPSKGYIYLVDSLAMFKIRGKNKEQGQLLLSKLVMSKEFQRTFNLKKGSIPARMDISLRKFDKCAKRSGKDIRYKSKKGGLLPSITHDMAISSNPKSAILRVVTHHFNSNISSSKATNNLADAVNLALNSSDF